MENYQIEIESVIANTEFNGDEIFDISHSPYVEEFVKTFDFYRETLTANVSRFKIKSSYIFFLNDNTVNAKAGISQNHNIICINAGLMIFLIQNIFEKHEIDESLKIGYKEIYQNLDNPINILMYQLALHFTFYHELGHLIQESENLKGFINERPTGIDEFDLTKHKLELDADSFSAMSIAAHIHQYAFKIFGETINSAQIEAVIEIFCSSILLYFLSFESYKEEMYYEESTHPHPVIRILNVILTITNYCKNSPKLQAKNIVINHNKIYDFTIINAMKIESEILNSSKAKGFTEIIGKQKKEILAYYGKLLAFNPKDFVSGIDKWNNTLP